MLPIINMVFVSHDAVHALNANIDTLVLRRLDETTAFHLTIKAKKAKKGQKESKRVRKPPQKANKS